MSEKEGVEVRTGKDALRRQAGQYATGCDWRAEEHRVDARFWQRWAWVLGGLAAVATAIASLALFKGAESGSAISVIGGAIAAAAAVFTALNTTVFSPQTNSGRASRSGRWVCVAPR